MNLSLQEQETHLNMTADDRGTWHVFSDDPVMQRRLEAIGATFVEPTSDGIGRFYTLRADQVLLRKGKPQRGPLSEAQRAALQRGHIRSKTLDAIGSENASNG